MSWRQRFGLRDGDLIIANHFDIERAINFAESLHEIECERVVVVDQQKHRLMVLSRGNCVSSFSMSHLPHDATISAASQPGVVGVGVIGVGFMGRTHLASYARTPHCAVRAVCDPMRRRAPAGNLITTSDDAEMLLATLPRADSVSELLARSDIQLVSICTPTETHVDLVLAAIAAGKHVLIEKPVSLDSRRISELDDHARAAGVLVMPAHCIRFWPAWRWMADAVRAQRFGPVKHASFRRLGAAPSWSQDFYLDFTRSGGAVVDLHIHDADFTRFAFGEPTSVAASGSRKHVFARYGFANDLQVEAEGGWMDDPEFAFVMTAVIECADGVIDYCFGREAELLVTTGGVTGGVTRRIESPLEYPTGNGYDHEIAALIDAIRTRAPAAPVTLADAVMTQRLLEREISMLTA